jgi:hypothetical protein
LSEAAFCFSGQGVERVDPRSSTWNNFSAPFTDGVDMCFRIAEWENLIAEEDVSLLELFGRRNVEVLGNQASGPCRTQFRRIPRSSL